MTKQSTRHKAGRLAAAALVVAAIVPVSSPPSSAETVEVIVREVTPATDAAEAAVMAMGGEVADRLDILGGFVARIPADQAGELQEHPAVVAVTPNASLQLSTAGWDDASGVDFNPNTYEGAVNTVAGGILQVSDYWSRGFTGAGVDVALIDSGVVPVNGLTYPGKVINGPDLSFESQSDDLRYLDTFGHGTHMAGIIVGRDDGAPIDANSNSDFLGVAPGSRLVNIKVADHEGATDVSQVIAAIDWVVQHRNDNGMNIRVLNLSFGTDSTQSYLLDPLAYAVERAWEAGIVVVVAAGNDGNSSDLRNPAMDPFVIAVGATNSAKTRPGVSQVMSFSNCGTSARSVDVVVPGQSIASLRNPGSAADQDHPESVVAGRYMLGSGTSQAAAFVSGMAALVVDENPTAAPDQVKAALMNDASAKFKKSDPNCYGAGVPNLDWIASSIKSDGLPVTVQTHAPATGLGTLEGARGSEHLEHEGVVLEGEQDIFGNAWDGWCDPLTTICHDTFWNGGDWNGATWTGGSWSGGSWSGGSWSGASWSGGSWSGGSWSGGSWSGNTWSGGSWSGGSWSGGSWSGGSWSGSIWLGLSWD